jgi:hypothetical protein
MFFPVAGDFYYGSVTALLPMTGTNDSTTFSDKAPTANTFTASGNARISTAQSKWGNGSGYFDGTGDYVSGGALSAWSLAGNANYTIECWVRPAALPASTVLFTCLWNAGSTASDCQWLLGYNHNTNKLVNDFRKNDGSTYVSNTFSGTLTLNTWQHIAVCRNGTTFYGFINGTLLGTNTITSELNSYNANMRAFVGALSATTPANFYTGYMQDLRITKTTRYTSNFVVPNGPLPPRYPDLPIHRRVVQQPSHQSISRLGL